MIRTRDPLLPKQMLYQAELRPDLRSHLPLSLVKVKSPLVGHTIPNSRGRQEPEKIG